MKGEKGSSLIEVLVALAILGVIGMCFLGSLGTTATAAFTSDNLETAKNLAETQIEYVKVQEYDTSYTPTEIPPECSDYTAVIDVEPLQDGNIQKITVTIELQGRAVIELEDYKVK